MAGIHKLAEGVDDSHLIAVVRGTENAALRSRIYSIREKTATTTAARVSSLSAACMGQLTAAPLENPAELSPTKRDCCWSWARLSSSSVCLDLRARSCASRVRICAATATAS